jgi:hypothetical protein
MTYSTCLDAVGVSHTFCIRLVLQGQKTENVLRKADELFMDAVRRCLVFSLAS